MAPPNERPGQLPSAKIEELEFEMLRSTVKSRYASTVAVAALLVMGGTSAALADPFTWNPSAAVPSADGTFTADNITVNDYAAISITNASTGAFSETGLLNLSRFTSGGTQVALPGLG